MGASLVYLDKPKTEIEFTNGENKSIKFCDGEMQGWRLNMVSLFLSQDWIDCNFAGKCIKLKQLCLKKTDKLT